MHRFLLLFLLHTLILLHQNVFSQRIHQFSADPGQFAGELKTFMGTNLNEKQVNGMGEFVSLWESAALKQSEMEAVVLSANKFLSRNARPVPHMLNFLGILSLFMTHDTERQHFPVWQRSFNDLLERDYMTPGKINEFVTVTSSLISDSLLSSSSSVSWKASRADFRMEYGDSLRIIFGSFNLMAFNHIDTLAILNTTGILCPVSMTWRGKGGTVTWERAGLEAGEAYATLENYTIDLSGSEYSADSAMFTYSRYFQSPMSGKLTDRVLTSRNAMEASYPRFVSHRQELSIVGIYSDVDYEGGLSMEGAKLIGSGGVQNNARLFFYRDGERWLTAESGYFVFRNQGTSSVSSSIMFYLENDTVFHPDVQMNYMDHTRELSVNQNQKVLSQSSWYNQYHQVDMNFAQLLWKTDEPKMRLTMPRASSIGNASFESLNFFDNNQYQSLQGMDAQHPLLLLRNFSRQINSHVFPAEEYARFLRRPLPQIRRQLLELTLKGFIFFDTDTDIIVIRNRLDHYLQASVRRIDYDNINFTSTTNSPNENAILDLETYEMKINGIPRVFISSSHNVNIFPENNTVKLERNRNFKFDGRINAGNMSFFGSNFIFDYDDFNIDLTQVDSLSLRAWQSGTDNLGQAQLTEVKNLIRTIQGELEIDQPDNKSGRVNNEEFPKFRSLENSYVYYGKSDIQNGVYDPENFYFELEPFLMDSLSSFRNEDLKFKGKLVSAGIFPDIEEILVLQDDYSLGINHTLRDTGLPAYGGRGVYYRDLMLDNSGLRGNGRLEFITSVFHSDDFLFLPDSMNARTNEFLINKQTTGVEFPSAESRNNIVQWLPYDEVLTVSQTDNNFELFDGQAELEGKLSISPSGLAGEGTVNLENASISSENYKIRSESFIADSGSLFIQVPDRPDRALIAGGLSGTVDMGTRQGNFLRNPGADLVSLPANRYITDPVSFTWKMDEKKLEFSSQLTDPVTGLKGAKFISTLQGQDSLSFVSPYAVLDYQTDLLSADEVKYIEVADAIIYPAGETILIGNRASLHPLKDARISANREDSYHEIYNALVEIEGKNKYSGSGYYDYIDELNEVYTIHLDNISVNGDMETIASGTVNGEQRFMINPAFSFEGETGLMASRRNLNFRGGAGILQDCEGITVHQLAFEYEIDPNDVMIPVPAQPMSADRERVYSGIFVATDSVHIYPAFFSTRKNWSDQLVISADGYIKYDGISGEYRIAGKEKLSDPENQQGNIVVFNPSECIIRGEGKVELGVTLGQVGIAATGQVHNLINADETSISGIITLDFPLSEDALVLLSQQADSIGGQPLDSSIYYFRRGLEELLGAERAGSYRNQSSTGGRPLQLPEELDKTFVLSDVNFKWNKESRSYRSFGKIGVAYVNGVPINSLFTGYLEITKRRSGDYLDFYIELDDNNWYYFGYTRGVMQTFSSSGNYIRLIEDMAMRHRRVRENESDERYVYMLASDNKLNQFFQTYRSHLKGETLVFPEGEIEGDKDENGEIVN